MEADLGSGAPVVCPGHTRPISELSFSGKTDDGVFFISGCVDQQPMLRDGATGNWIGTFDGHTGAVWSAKMNESGTRCATAGADFRIKIWDAIEGQQIAEFEDTSVVKSVDFSVDAKSIVAGGYSKRLLVFTLSGVSKSPVLAIDHPSRIRKLATLPTGLIITGDDAGVLRTWSIEGSGSLVHELKPVGIAKPEVHDISVIKSARSGPLAPSGAGVVVCCGRWVRLVAVAADGIMAVVHQVKIPFLARIDSADLHPNGTTLVLGGGDAASAATSKGGQASLYVFMVELQRMGTAGVLAGAGPTAAPTAATSSPSAAVFPSSALPSGPSYAAAAATGSSRTISASTAAASGSGSRATAGGSAGAGADGSAGASGGGAGGKRDPVGCRIVSISKGHVGPIRCLRFAPEATKFASGGEDGNIRLWSTSAQTMAGTGGMGDLPAVNDDGVQIDRGAPSEAKPRTAGKPAGVYRPGAFGGSARRRP